MEHKSQNKRFNGSFCHLAVGNVVNYGNMQVIVSVHRPRAVWFMTLLASQLISAEDGDFNVDVSPRLEYKHLVNGTAESLPLWKVMSAQIR